MDINSVADRLQTHDNILILTHRRPDGDTIGCGVALCLALRQLGKTAHVLENREAHELFRPYLEGVSIDGSFQPQYVVSVDTAALDLLPDNAEKYRDCIDLSIDHHSSNQGYAKETCVDASAAACGELLYKIIVHLGVMTPAIAEYLYIAISTDTGGFIFSNTTAETHRISASLMETGFDVAGANKRHFRSKSLARFRLEGILTEEMLVLDGGKIAMASITFDVINRVGAVEEDLENIAAFLEVLKGVETAIIIRELRADVYKISVRTNRSLNASEVCAVFGGGGHPAAAGATLAGKLEDVKARLVEAIRAVQAKGC